MEQQQNPIMSSYGEEDDYDEESDGTDNDDAKSQVVSQHPLSSLGNEVPARKDEAMDDEDEEDILYDEENLLRAPLM